jgi:hypothetical protein
MFFKIYLKKYEKYEKYFIYPNYGFFVDSDLIDDTNFIFDMLYKSDSKSDSKSIN